MKTFQSIKRHPLISIFVSALAAALLIYAAFEGKTLPMSAYLAAMLLAALTVDFLAGDAGAGEKNLNVKSPARELKWILATQIIALIVTIARFQIFTDWRNTGAAVKLPLLALLILFVFPVVLLIVFFKWKYSLKDLGFRLKGIWLGLPVILITASTTYFFAYEKIKLAALYQEMGLISMVLTGFLMAALPEEIIRFLLQTRIGKVFGGNYAFGWFAASIIWAFLHLPNFYAQSENLASAVWAVLAIAPIGLLWGFMTHRTGTILPAVTAHGTNVWGLQNF